MKTKSRKEVKMFSIKKFKREDDQCCYFDGVLANGSSVGIVIRKSDLDIFFDGEDVALGLGYKAEEDLLGNDDTLDKMLDMQMEHDKAQNSFINEMSNLINNVQDDSLKLQMHGVLHGFKPRKS